MTVVEAYAGKKMMDPPEDGSKLHVLVSSLLDEGISQNSTGSVFLSKVESLSLSFLFGKVAALDACLPKKAGHPMHFKGCARNSL